MTLVEKLQILENFVCNHFEDIDLDNPVEEGYFEDYQAISGASSRQIQDFEEKFKIQLPDDVKQLYAYKNGSEFFTLFPASLDERSMNFQLMSLQAIKESKEYFQNKNALLTDFPDYFSPADMERMQDNRIQPYLFHKQWFPFAVYADSCFLMLDFTPGTQGKLGQIICYLHDPDQVFYVADSLSSFLNQILETRGL